VTQDEKQFFDVERLGEVIDRACPDGLHSRFGIAMR
jgi:hypothetical protein